MSRTSPLLKFVFNYKRFQCRIPVVPVRFVRADGISTQIINAVLDSGADTITIPQDLATWLQLKLEPRDTPAMTAAGTIKAYKAMVPELILGQGGRDVHYKNIEVCVMEKCPYILIGISPIFEDYKVTVIASQRQFILEPLGKNDSELSKEAIQAIEAARKRMDKGHYYTEEDAKKILGID